MSSLQLIAFFDERRRSGAPMVMVTVVETSGSTYSKPGYRMLIDDQNLYYGLVSGGCLEGDLVEHAKLVFREGKARIVSYDLRGDQDELWGIGIGCNGLTRLLLQLVASDNAYEPMRSITDAWQGNVPRVITWIAASTHPEMPTGTTRIRTWDGHETNPNRALCELDPRLSLLTNVRPLSPSVTRLSGCIDGCEVQALQQILLPLPRILVLGAGPDAAPVVQGFLAMGWRVTVGDQREGMLARAEFGRADRLYVQDDDQLERYLRESMPSAILIMSHNLRSDIRYLRLAAECNCVYLGVLGPRHRRDRLLESLDPPLRSQVESRLIGPVGLDIGADSPASIALSIVTQVFIQIKTALWGDAGALPHEDGASFAATRGIRAERAPSID